jgi:hypothetical protein
VKVGAVPGLGTWRIAGHRGSAGLVSVALRAQGVGLATIAGLVMGAVGGSAAIAGLATATALLIAFLVIERRSIEPLVRLSIFAVRTVRGANVVMFVVACGLFAMFFFNTLYLQSVLGYSPLRAGLAFLPFTVGIIIGAGVSMSSIMANRDLAFLAPVAGIVGGPAVRNMATVGGNLFARSPYGDFTAGLLALGASVQFAGQGGRGPGIDEFLRDRERYRSSLVQSVSVPRPREVSAFRFVKVSRVKPKGISVLSIAALLPQTGGRLQGVRVAYGAMGDTPLRASAVERVLEGGYLDTATI